MPRACESMTAFGTGISLLNAQLIVSGNTARSTSLGRPNCWQLVDANTNCSSWISSFSAPMGTKAFPQFGPLEGLSEV
ncbi:hypothetical protein M514_13366 [Trichuris suis]|uniref:Uncharacterized protein n=1 Tax=Trichuris suis TaxID=68888 RepID=A0A085LLB4_9BILA|nr:hypothetical protein M513_13366 [Trichuris suis]KFD67158.1 hypothetical protein M514_13366 [Trichuris suis]